MVPSSACLSTDDRSMAAMTVFDRDTFGTESQLNARLYTTGSLVMLKSKVLLSELQHAFYEIQKIQ